MTRKHLNIVTNDQTTSNFAPEEQLLLDNMLEAYGNRRLGTLNHTERTVRSDLATIRDFFNYINKTPWEATEDDFDAWCYHLGIERKVVTDTQRKYQTAIQFFYTYIVENIRFRGLVLECYNINLKQIVTTENKIPHLTERQRTNERPAFSHEQIDTLFASIDRQIIESYEFSGKDFLALQRDKVMFYTMYTLGLRDSECRDIDVSSFRPNASIPSFGKFGFVTVYGKGSRGTGPKIRTVPIDHPDLPPLLEWYMKEIRPMYLMKAHADPNETAFFLTERASRIKVNTLIYRFHKVVDYAGLGGLGFTPHCLRHTFTTHAMEAGRSLEYTRRKLGHEYASTTQGYTHCGDEFVAREIKQSTASILDQAIADGEQNRGDKNET